MTDLVARLREAIDNEQVYAETADHLSRQDSVSLLRRCAADRKILDLWDGTVEVRDIAWDKFRAGEMPTKSESTHATHAERELAALQVVLEALAEAYGVEV